MSRRQKGATLDLTPGRLNLCLYHGVTDELDVYRRDSETGAELSLTGWSGVAAVMRLTRGGVEVVDLAPTVVGDRIEIDITPAMKTALGSSRGVWEVDAINADGLPVTLVHGAVQILAEVVT